MHGVGSNYISNRMHQQDISKCIRICLFVIMEEYVAYVVFAYVEFFVAVLV